MNDRAPAGNAIPLDRLARQATRLAQLVNAATRAASASAGLTHADTDVLLALYGAPGHRLRPTALSTACNLSSGGTSNVILRLMQAGYVNREADAYDGRSTWVQLTMEGEALASSVLESATAAHARLLDRLPGGIAVALDELLEIALGHLDDGAGR
ncbi:MarR family transcriptional regulator [Streptomyces sp. CJ_13]|uniref:MarR family winged helix-turn-helix transcriptional regulator n=1 Tax=Streptomyces TaxID=1883 RepID=UPI000F3A857B|nr:MULTISPECIES: MarR family transcriptional regulator [unclassified Streptomyces]AYV32518.1 MarR family protein [Streptomyces sp. ADI95-16]MBT1186046.1 MarR family transcriptional regulator [Streptomyces sp. CJ_13]